MNKAPKPRGKCPRCKAVWNIHRLLNNQYRCPNCRHQLKFGSNISTVDEFGTYLTPCTRERADEEVLKGTAKWLAPNLLLVVDSPTKRKRVRASVFQRDGGICQWCGNPGTSVDHIVPGSQGGPFIEWNLLCACNKCNHRRGDIPATDYLASLEEAGKTPEEVEGLRARIAVALAEFERFTEAQPCDPAGR